MTDYARLRELAEKALPDGQYGSYTFDGTLHLRKFQYKVGPETVLALLDEIAELNDRLEVMGMAKISAEPVNVSEFEVPYATRLEVVGEAGRIITRRDLEPGVRILVQDGARTVKVFIQEGEET